MKPIKFTLNGLSIQAELESKVAKKDLYGYAKKVVLKDDVVLEKGYISAEGQLIPRKALSLEKCDPLGTPLEPVQIELNGEDAVKRPSTLEEAADLLPAQLADLVGFNVTDVYPITIQITPGVYATQFAYYANILRKEAFLLVKESGQAFLLVGESKSTAWIGNVVLYDFFNSSEEDEDGDELDFDMI